MGGEEGEMGVCQSREMKKGGVDAGCYDDAFLKEDARG